MSTSWCLIEYNGRQKEIHQRVNILLSYFPEGICVFQSLRESKQKWIARVLSDMSHGDIAVLRNIRCLGNTALERRNAIQMFQEKDVDLYFTDQPLLGTAAIRKVLAELGVKSEGDDDIIKAQLGLLRVAEEYQQLEEQARNNRYKMYKEDGHQIGGRSGISRSLPNKSELKEQIRKEGKDFGGTKKDSELIEELGISRRTYYLYKKEIKNED